MTGARQGETLANVIRQAHVRFYFFGANGRIVVGAFGLVLVISSVTGLLIYAPFVKAVFKQNLRFWQLRKGVRPAVSDFHKLAGILTLVFNLILGLTGAVLGLENLSRYHQPTDALIHPRPDKKLKPRNLENRLSLDAAAESARRGLPGFSPNAVTLPRAGTTHLVFAGDLRGRFERRNASFVVVDTQSGAVLQTHDARRTRPVTRLYNLSEPLHFGDFPGLPMKILYFVFGAMGTALTATGFAILYFRKRKTSLAGRIERTTDAVRIKVQPRAASADVE